MKEVEKLQEKREKRRLQQQELREKRALVCAFQFCFCSSLVSYRMSSSIEFPDLVERISFTDGMNKNVFCSCYKVVMFENVRFKKCHV